MSFNLEASEKLATAHLTEGPPYVKHLYETVCALRQACQEIRELRLLESRYAQMIKDLGDKRHDEGDRLRAFVVRVSKREWNNAALIEEAEKTLGVGPRQSSSTRLS